MNDSLAALTQKGNNTRNISTTTDTLFALTVATAPEASRPMLEKVQKSLGLIPNLMAIFANDATVLEKPLALRSGG